MKCIDNAEKSRYNISIISERDETERVIFMAISIKDVALEAGVSKTTASDALNNLSKVKPETRKKVLNVAKKLGYKPNISARELITRKKLNLGIVNINKYASIINSNAGYFKCADDESFFDIVSIIMDKISKTQYGLLMETLQATDNDLPIPEFLKSDRVAGIIIVSTMYNPPKYIEKIKQYTQNVVSVGSYYDQCDCVRNDYESAIYKAVEYLIQNGHRKIGFINGDKKSWAYNQKWSGFQKALADYGYPICESWITDAEFVGRSGYEAVKRLWERPGEKPTALCFSADIIACGALRYFYENGVNVPGDVSLIGFENSILAAFSTPPLTTIDRCKRQMGVVACDLITNRLENSNAPYRDVIVPFSLWEGGSVKKI